MITQHAFRLKEKRRGFHLITHEVMENLPELPAAGLLHLFIQHTSAALAINENADPDVRVDFESITNQLIPEGRPFYTHTLEGEDDMPAHVKASLYGSSVSIPISSGKLNLGTWQGIYLCEFRNSGGCRSIVATIIS